MVRTESDEGDCTRRRQVRHRFIHTREACMSDRGWAIVPVLNADDIEDILGAATPPRERARAHHSQYPKRMESDNTMSIAHRRPNRTSDDERGRRFASTTTFTFTLCFLCPVRLFWLDRNHTGCERPTRASCPSWRSLWTRTARIVWR
jgi:hypothetical protein